MTRTDLELQQRSQEKEASSSAKSRSVPQTRKPPEPDLDAQCTMRRRVNNVALIIRKRR